jgi:adenylylsulfate reductase subunit B
VLKISYGPKIDYKACSGCGKCYEDCPMDVFDWNNERQKPIVEYPGECRFCGYCEMGCPEIAIDIQFPLHAMLDFGIDPRSLRGYFNT